MTTTCKMTGSEYLTDVDPKWLMTLIKKSSYDAKPVEIVDVSITLASALGENFLSKVYRVQITALLGSGRRKTYSTIVKIEIPGGKVQSVMGVLSIFPIEIKAYTVILPMMEELMEEFNDTRDKIWCGCLGYRPYNTLVMEDLVAEGFTSIDRTKWQTIDQARMVLRTLGRFHAMSKILIGRGHIGDRDRGHNLFVNDSNTFRTLFPAAMKALSNTIDSKWEQKWKLLGQKVSKAKHVICDKMIEAAQYDKKFEVLNHGDLWSSNTMWKCTEYGGVPVSVRFIDWQFIHLNSFIVDVIYFMFTSVVPSLRRENVNLLLETYQESLEKNLKYFGWEGYMPTKDDVLNEYNRAIYLAFVFVSICLPVTSTGISGLSIDIGSLFDIPPEEIYNEQIFMEEKYVREVAPDLQSFYELGVI